MPFKTKREKQKAREHWAQFTQDGLVSYRPSRAKAKKNQGRVASGPAIEGRNLQSNLFADTSYAGGEIIKIALLALLVIGLQMFIKVYHIGN